MYIWGKCVFYAFWMVCSINTKFILSNLSFKAYVSFWFLPGSSVHWWKGGVKVHYYYCVTVDCSFYGCQYLHYTYWGAPMSGAYMSGAYIYIYHIYIYIYKIYIYILYISIRSLSYIDWSLDHCIVSFFVSCNSL